MPGLAPQYPRIRLISPTRRRIAYVHIGSNTSEQLYRLGWTRYDGPAKVYTHHAGPGRADAAMNPALDPRNGFIIPNTDPALEPSTLPSGSFDNYPNVGQTAP